MTWVSHQNQTRGYGRFRLHSRVLGWSPSDRIQAQGRVREDRKDKASVNSVYRHQKEGESLGSFRQPVGTQGIGAWLHLERRGMRVETVQGRCWVSGVGARGRFASRKWSKCESLIHIWLCNTMGCYLPSYPVYGILQARILEWVVIPFSGRSSWPRNQTQVSCIIGRFFTNWASREALWR